MLRYCVLLAVIAFSKNVYVTSYEEGLDAGILSKCEEVEGDSRGCYECYPCDHQAVISHGEQHYNILNLHVNDPSCNNKTQVCCIAQVDLLSYRSTSDCGKHYPYGQPASSKTSPLSVLSGEYPWRAWVYDKTRPANSRCAATYISEVDRALIAPASCVYGQNVANLGVTFTRGATHFASVDTVTTHEEYNALTHHNDIAIINFHSLELIPSWAAPACLPMEPPPHATPCVTVSENDRYINTVIPLKENCTDDGTLLHDSLSCAVSRPDAYNLEIGSGLYCLQQSVPMPAFLVYGLSLTQENQINTYTNISYFYDWLQQKVPGIQ